MHHKHQVLLCWSRDSLKNRYLPDPSFNLTSCRGALQCLVRIQTPQTELYLSETRLHFCLLALSLTQKLEPHSQLVRPQHRDLARYPKAPQSSPPISDIPPPQKHLSQERQALPQQKTIGSRQAPHPSIRSDELCPAVYLPDIKGHARNAEPQPNLL